MTEQNWLWKKCEAVADQVMAEHKRCGGCCDEPLYVYYRRGGVRTFRDSLPPNDGPQRTTEPVPWLLAFPDRVPRNAGRRLLVRWLHTRLRSVPCLPVEDGEFDDLGDVPPGVGVKLSKAELLQYCKDNGHELWLWKARSGAVWCQTCGAFR